MKSFRAIQGSTGTRHDVLMKEADGTMIDPTDVDTVTCRLQTRESVKSDSDGTKVANNLVPTGFTFSWYFGDADLGTPENIEVQWILTKTGGNPIKTERYLMEIEEAI